MWVSWWPGPSWCPLGDGWRWLGIGEFPLVDIKYIKMQIIRSVTFGIRRCHWSTRIRRWQGMRWQTDDDMWDRSMWWAIQCSHIYQSSSSSVPRGHWLLMFSCQVSSDDYFLSFPFATLLNVCDRDDVKTFPIFAKVHRTDCPSQG